MKRPAEAEGRQLAVGEDVSTPSAVARSGEVRVGVGDLYQGAAPRVAVVVVPHRSLHAGWEPPAMREDRADVGVVKPKHLLFGPRQRESLGARELDRFGEAVAL